MSETGKLKPVDQRRLVLRDDFGRGYFCAVAVYLKESCQDGVADTMAQSLFRQGGDWQRADAEDIETFRIHGLIPAENADVDTRRADARTQQGG